MPGGLHSGQSVENGRGRSERLTIAKAVRAALGELNRLLSDAGPCGAGSCGGAERGDETAEEQRGTVGWRVHLHRRA